MTDAHMICGIVTATALAVRGRVAVRPVRSPRPSTVDHRPADHVRQHPHGAPCPCAIGIMAPVHAQARQATALDKRRANRCAILRP